MVGATMVKGRLIADNFTNKETNNMSMIGGVA